MKKHCAILSVIAILLCCLSSCGKSDYARDREAKEEAIYQRGYEDGYDEGYFDGSDDGWMYNIEEPGRYLEEEAVDYARKQSGWTPEEAWMLIDAYQNQEPWYEDGSVPSEQDYLDAINSLIYFYDYFYSKKYD